MSPGCRFGWRPSPLPRQIKSINGRLSVDLLDSNESKNECRMHAETPTKIYFQNRTKNSCSEDGVHCIFIQLCYALFTSYIFNFKAFNGKYDLQSLSEMLFLNKKKFQFSFKHRTLPVITSLQIVNTLPSTNSVSVVLHTDVCKNNPSQNHSCAFKI